MAAESVVLDSSVALKWFLPEQDSDLAQDILLAILHDRVRLHAPQLFRYEVCGVLTSKCLSRDSKKEPVFPLEEALEAIDSLFSIAIDVAEANQEESVSALSLAVRHSNKYYDMTYVQLAEKLDTRFITADERILEGVRDDFPVHRVVVLSSLRDK